MAMNKKGQVLFYSIMIGVVLFFLGINLAKPLLDVFTDVRTNLSCDVASTYQEKANCVIVDVMLPLFIGVLFGFAGMVIGGRLL